MDFITGLPKSEGKEVIMVIVDRLTKYAHFLALSHPYKASDVAQTFLDSIYKLHGLPRDIISDRDPIFTSKFWQELMHKLGVKLNMSTAYHPQTDGQTERVNQCLENYLRCMTYEKQKNWVRHLTLAEWWYNTTYHSAIKMSPFEALYGYSPPQLGLGSIPRSSVEAVDSVLKDRQATLRQLKANMIKTQERTKQYADRNRSERKFEEGDWVYLKLQPYRQVSMSGLKNQKLSSRYCGPYELKARVGDNQAVSPSLPLVGTAGNLQSKPLAVLARRMVKRKNVAETQLLVQWENQPAEDATWEDYKVIEKRFPKFLLEVEKILKKGGVSGMEIQLGIIESNLDLIKAKGERGDEWGREGSGSGNKLKETDSLSLGPALKLGLITVEEDFCCELGPSLSGMEKTVARNGEEEESSG